METIFLRIIAHFYIVRLCKSVCKSSDENRYFGPDLTSTDIIYLYAIKR